MFSDRLVTLRTKAGFSQVELAKRLQMTRGQLSMYEIGKRKPDMETLQRIADYFDVSIDYLVGRTIQKKEYEPQRESSLAERLLEGIPNLEDYLPPEKANFFRWIDENVEGEFYYEFDERPEESKLQFLKDLLYLWGRDTKIKNPKKDY